VVIFNGRVVDLVEATEATEERLMRAAYGLASAEGAA
jgi:ribose transport system ATP-binding protein